MNPIINSPFNKMPYHVKSFVATKIVNLAVL